MKYFLFVAFCVACLKVFGQELEITTTHYDKDGQLTLHQSTSYYYVIDSTFEGMSHKGAFYTSNGKPRYIEPMEKINAARERSLFYEDGSLMAVATIELEQPKGVVKMMYPNGEPLATVDFISSNRYNPDVKIVAYWSDDGSQIVDKGTGFGQLLFPLEHDALCSGEGQVVNGRKHGKWKGSWRGSTYEETFKDGRVVSGRLLKDGKEYSYEKPFVLASPENGLQSFYKLITTTLRYPVDARRNGIEGKVFAGLTIEPDGKVSDISIIKGVHPDLDEETIRVMKQSPPWIPEKVRGIPVQSKVAVPLTFKLG